LFRLLTKDMLRLVHCPLGVDCDCRRMHPRAPHPTPARVTHTLHTQSLTLKAAVLGWSRYSVPAGQALTCVHCRSDQAPSGPL
jgi:hypothetical protein